MIDIPAKKKALGIKSSMGMAFQPYEDFIGKKVQFTVSDTYSSNCVVAGTLKDFNNHYVFLINDKNQRIIANIHKIVIMEEL